MKNPGGPPAPLEDVDDSEFRKPPACAPSPTARKPTSKANTDWAEIKLRVVIPGSRGNRDLGASHRSIYREFQPEDGGPPYREVVCFEHRKNDRPFEAAADRLGRAVGVRRSTLGSYGASSDISPIRQALSSDLPQALAAAGNVAPARIAPSTPRTNDAQAPRRGGGQDGRER